MARGRGKTTTNGHTKKRHIERYEHKGKKRINNPPVGLVTPETDPPLPTHKVYDYIEPVPSVKPGKVLDYDSHLDPQLVWAGKKEHASFEVPTVSLHVHETIDPRTIVEAVRKQNGNGAPTQPSLFERPEEKLSLHDAIDFYKHSHGWSNRLIAGDSLLIMNSLLEKEGMAGQVQMVYIDPPYGIKYGSNFQPFVNKRKVQDGKDEDLTQEPEMIRAFRDTWELGVHSYLTYLRDRLLLARELLHESGSCFVQISDENVHNVRAILDETFGPQNFVALLNFRSMMPLESGQIESVFDYVCWYAKDKSKLKYRNLFVSKTVGEGSEFVFSDSGKGELISRKVAHVDLPARTIRLEEGETKNGEARVVTLAKNSPAYNLLVACVQGKEPKDRVFTHKDGTPVSDFRKTWWRACIAAGLGRMACLKCGKTVTKRCGCGKPLMGGKCDCGKKAMMRCECGCEKAKYDGLLVHDLRRTAARNLRNLEIPEITIMAIGGWKTRKMFERYSIVSPKDAADALEKAEAARRDKARQQQPAVVAQNRISHNLSHNSPDPAPEANEMLN